MTQILVLLLNRVLVGWVPEKVEKTVDYTYSL